MIKTLPILVLMLCTQVFSSDFESETPDILVQEQHKKASKGAGFSISKEITQEDAIFKPDPLLETLKKEKKDEPTLLEKILLQRDSRGVDNPKKVFKKPLIKSDEINTPDPLLDEI